MRNWESANSENETGGNFFPPRPLISRLPLSYYLCTSFSGHRPAQRECARTGLRSHARCHPYPIPQTVKVGHTTRVYDPYSFRIVMWGLLRPTTTNQWKCCETGPTVFRPYARRLESLTNCRCHYKGSTFFSVFKDPECRSAGVWSRDISLGRSALSQLSYLNYLRAWNRLGFFLQAHVFEFLHLLFYLAINDWGWVGCEELSRSRRVLSTEVEGRGG